MEMMPRRHTVRAHSHGWLFSWYFFNIKEERTLCMLQATNDPSQGEAALRRFFSQGSRTALAFSGGCDSAYLLALAARAGCDVRPYFVKGDFQPEFELEDARRLCEELGVELTVLHAQPLNDEQVVQNGPRRCYYCKKMIFSALVEAAKKDGCTTIWDGTNASDAEGDRPGMKALRELEVQSPLRICGLTKAQVREGSRRMGLFTWNKPAYACLATRIPTGTALQKQDLVRVEKAEAALFEMGFSNLRLRLMGEIGRLQLPASQLEQAAARHKEITDQLAPWVNGVLLDLQPRAEES